MVSLLDSMARDRLIDSWSSREMLAILDGQTHNGLLPSPLPKQLKIAHKTGSLHDTLNDVGIVYLSDEPYVIAVMTTQLRSLSNGRHFIHNISKMTYDELGRFAAWRESSGLPPFAIVAAPQSCKHAGARARPEDVGRHRRARTEPARELAESYVFYCHAELVEAPTGP